MTLSNVSKDLNEGSTHLLIDELNLFKAISKGVHPSSTKDFGDVSRLFSTVQDNKDYLRSPLTSPYDDSDQKLFDSVLYNNLDIISNNKLFKRLKDYEQKYGFSSSEFYKKWVKGEISSSSEVFDWMILYKNLFNPG